MELSSDQQQAFDLLKSDKNVFLTGRAGTGKSFLIHEYLKTARLSKMLLTAPTGVAAFAINGVTLHNLFQIPIHPLGPNDMSRSGNVFKTLDAADTIFIDEVSMVRADVFQYIYNTLKACGKRIRVIAVGDFLQLEPILKDAEKKSLQELWGNTFVSPFCFDTPAWRDLNFSVCELTTNHRQKAEEREFITSLHKIREGKDIHSAITSINKLATIVSNNQIPSDAVSLCPYNKTVDQINSTKLNEIPSPEYHYHAAITGNPERSLQVATDLILKPGAMVIATANDSDGYYQNGCVGTVIECYESNVLVEFTTERTNIETLPNGKVVAHKEDIATRVMVTPYTWDTNAYTVVERNVNGKKVKELKLQKIGSIDQIPLRLGWAVTIHKAQGKTLTNALINPGARFFANAQLYVALSRVTESSGLYLTRPLKDQDCMVSPRALAFYEHNMQTNAPCARLTTENVHNLKVSQNDLDTLMTISAKYNFPATMSRTERLTNTLHKILEEQRENLDNTFNTNEDYEFALQETVYSPVETITNSRASGFRAFLRR